MNEIQGEYQRVLCTIPPSERIRTTTTTTEGMVNGLTEPKFKKKTGESFAMMMMLMMMIKLTGANYGRAAKIIVLQ